MGKGALKFGGKSGILPKPKDIFKQPYKHQVYKKPANSGYAEGILHPKNITRDYIPPKVVSPDTLLKKSAAEPAKKVTEAELEQMPISQQFKVKNAEMRRKYLKEAYETEVQRLERREHAIKQAKIEEEKIAAESANHKASKAEIFTSPTIESYLEGPLVRERTEEEKEMLRLKRESNRLQTKLEVDNERATKLLQLYNASANFAITEEKLEKLVDAAFDSKADQTWNNIASATPSKISAVKNDVTFDYALVDVVLDNVNTGPGYDAVSDYLDGFTDDIRELAQQIKEEKNANDLKTATENLDKISESNSKEDKDN
ncbi:hypothetical protein CANINC_002290 [Pichia inconspicua]|uniref:Uncharacterized protein n=1 Tax=Pichia inconspicua TaxID=52247 RepID=A0A4V6TTR7_9ASCO|nr:hypothetical protein CANINC_002290 [[Candida] inconspicua]